MPWSSRSSEPGEDGEAALLKRAPPPQSSPQYLDWRGAASHIRLTAPSASAFDGASISIRDITADANARDAVEAEALQRAFDRTPLRIQNTLARSDEDLDQRQRGLVLHPPQHLLVSFLDVAKVATKAILVELLARGLVPEAAGIGTDFVAEQNLAVMTSEFEFEIDQQDAARI